MQPAGYGTPGQPQYVAVSPQPGYVGQPQFVAASSQQSYAGQPTYYAAQPTYPAQPQPTYSAQPQPTYPAQPQPTYAAQPQIVAVSPQPAYGAQPQYGPQGPQQQATGPPPTDWLIPAILCCFVFIFTGIPAVIKACSANKAKKRGDLEAARKDADCAKKLVIASIAAGVTLLVICIILLILMTELGFGLYALHLNKKQGEKIERARTEHEQWEREFDREWEEMKNKQGGFPGRDNPPPGGWNWNNRTTGWWNSPLG